MEEKSIQETDQMNIRLKGKTAVWFWLVYVIATGMTLQGLFFSESSLPVMIFAAVTVQAVFLPILLRNYVTIEAGKLTVCFGFGRESISVDEIVEVRRTCDPIASSAASLDRILIKTRRNEVMCSVREKEKMFEVLRQLNPDIKIC